MSSFANQPNGAQPMQGQIPMGAFSTTKPLSTGKIVLMVFLSFAAFPVGTIGVLIYGINKMTSNTDTVEWTEEVPQYVPDSRHSSGSRYIGNATVRQKQTVIASPDVLAINKSKGIVAVATALAMGILMGLVLWLN